MDNGADELCIFFALFCFCFVFSSGVRKKTKRHVESGRLTTCFSVHFL